MKEHFARYITQADGLNLNNLTLGRRETSNGLACLASRLNNELQANVVE